MRRPGKTYGSLHYDLKKDCWVVSDIPPHVALRLKQLFPRVPKYSSGPFQLSGTKDVAADLSWFTTRYPLDIAKHDSNRLKKVTRSYFQEQADAEAILLPTRTPTERPGLKEGQALRNYQKVGIDFIDEVRSLVLVDDVGLGKSYEGLAVGLIKGALPLVIVVEPHLQQQWAEKAEGFIDLKVHAPKGNTPYSLPDADIYIFKYNQLSPWVDVLTQGWVNAIVFDEVQQLRRGEESAKGAAAARICAEVDIKVGMTATLIYNFGIEAFNIIEMLRPGVLGTRSDFIREWCTENGNQKGVVKDPDALGTYLREVHMLLRRTKADVGQEAKQQEPTVEWVPPDVDGVAADDSLMEELAVKTLSGDFHVSGQAARELDMRMREVTGIAKAKATAAYVRMFVETGQPVLLFGWHRAVYDIWAKELADLNPVWYTGSESPKQKEQAKQDFIAGKSPIMIMSLRSGAGADGIHRACSTAIFGEFDWSPQIHVQCVGRLDRDDQEDPVYAIYVATDYGSDPVIIDSLGVKSSQNEGVTDPGKKKSDKQLDRDRLKRLAREYLKRRGKKLPTPAPEKTGAEQIGLI